MKLAPNDQVVLQVEYLMMSCPEQMLSENILFKLTTKGKLLTSCPNKSTTMQTAEVSTSSRTCSNTNVVRSQSEDLLKNLVNVEGYHHS